MYFFPISRRMSAVVQQNTTKSLNLKGTVNDRVALNFLTEITCRGARYKIRKLPLKHLLDELKLELFVHNRNNCFLMTFP